MRVHHVDGLGIRRAAIGWHDPFLRPRRIPWGTIAGWFVLLASGVAWGTLVVLALAEWIG